jgi:hypothetical protein
MTLGNGNCQQDNKGAITSCSFVDDPNSPPAIFEPTSLKSEGLCWEKPVVEAPCFVTPEVDAALNVAGLIIGMKMVVVAGTFSGKNPKLEIVGGHLHGFLPKVIAQTIQLDLPNGQITLDQLLTQAPLEKNGNLVGWTLNFSFKAAQQAEK